MSTSIPFLLAWQSTCLKRVVAEGLCLFGILTHLLYGGNLLPILFLQGMDFLVLPGFGFYVAFRFAPIAGINALAKECSYAVLLVVGLILLRMSLNVWAFGGSLSSFPNGPFFEIYKALVFALLPYPLLRASHLILATWLPKKRERLRWIIATDAAFICFFISIGFVFLFAIYQANTLNLSQWLPANQSIYAVVVHRMVLGFLSSFMVGLFLATLLLPLYGALIILMANVTARHIDKRLKNLASWLSKETQIQTPLPDIPSGPGEIHQLKASLQHLVSRWKDHEEDLVAQKQHMDQLLENQRQWIAMISHDLRTPLTVAKSQLEHARNPTAGQPGQTTSLEHISIQMDHLQTMVDDLFASIQPAKGGPSFQKSSQDLDQFLSNLAESWALVAWRSYRITLRYFPTDQHCIWLFDPHRLRQILGNLIHNALQHTSPGGMVLLGLETFDDTYAICVSDTGSGIPKDATLAIWDAEYSSQGSDPARAGLGLAIVKNLVQTMGGQISLDSESGVGSRFTLRFTREMATE